MEQQFDQYQWTNGDEESSVDTFIHGRTRILKTKLEVLASEIHQRVAIRTSNLEQIDKEEKEISAKNSNPHFFSHYTLRDTSERNPFPDQLFELQTQRRNEDVECWRDVVQVMRDFLMAWETHEMAKAKADFLNNV